MTLPISLAAAGLPAIGMAAKGLKEVASLIPFSFGSKGLTPAAQPEVKTANSTDGLASESPSLQGRLKAVIESLHAAMRHAGINSNATHEISADGDQFPQIDSDDLEASQFAESWFSQNPDKVRELNSIVRDLRSNTLSDAPQGARLLDARRQTLKIISNSDYIETKWDSSTF